MSYFDVLSTFLHDDIQKRVCTVLFEQIAIETTLERKEIQNGV